MSIYAQNARRTPSLDARKWRRRYHGHIFPQRVRMVAGALIAAFMATGPAHGDPHSVPVQILSVRSYATGNASTENAYIATSASSVCSNATYFTISLASPSGPGMLSVALTALASGRSVTVEVSNSTGCTVEAGGGPQLQSLTLLANGYNGPF